MKSGEVQAALAAAVEDVLETMCFASVLHSSATSPGQGAGAAASAVRAELRFEGNPSGGFRLDVDSTAAQGLGAAFLGLEEQEVTEIQQGEVVCELANMICGSVLSKLERGTTFHITHPALVQASASAAYQSTDISRWFDLGGGGLKTCFRIRQGT